MTTHPVPVLSRPLLLKLTHMPNGRKEPAFDRLTDQLPLYAAATLATSPGKTAAIELAVAQAKAATQLITDPEDHGPARQRSAAPLLAVVDRCDHYDVMTLSRTPKGIDPAGRSETVDLATRREDQPTWTPTRLDRTGMFRLDDALVAVVSADRVWQFEAGSDVLVGAQAVEAAARHS